MLYCSTCITHRASSRPRTGGMARQTLAATVVCSHPVLLCCSVKCGNVSCCAGLLWCTGYSGKRFIFEKCHELGVKALVLDAPDSWAQIMETEGIISKFIPIDFADAEHAYDNCLKVCGAHCPEEGGSWVGGGVVIRQRLRGKQVHSYRLCQCRTRIRQLPQGARS